MAHADSNRTPAAKARTLETRRARMVKRAETGAITLPRLTRRNGGR